MFSVRYSTVNSTEYSSMYIFKLFGVAPRGELDMDVTVSDN